ncbi:MAG TPA: hypothetical protein VN892_17140 [Solirubrobacteraceae bacterium]|nr:hypothetical protein [Solirubrobacteraceae bacterium]
MEALVFSHLSHLKSSPLLRPLRRRACSLGLACATAGLSVAALAAAPAQAALISTGACNEAALSQPFAPWGDTNLYELVPGASFEGSLAGWTLSGGAQRVSGSEPFGATGSVGAYSLSLPGGSSAQTPFTCVNASYPSFRFFARNESLISTVLVQVVYQTALGAVALPLGTVALSAQWQPTLPMLTGSVLGGALSGGTGEVALRFTALTGSSRIDDVFIDPRMR